VCKQICFYTSDKAHTLFNSKDAQPSNLLFIFVAPATRKSSVVFGCKLQLKTASVTAVEHLLSCAAKSNLRDLETVCQCCCCRCVVAN